MNVLIESSDYPQLQKRYDQLSAEHQRVVAEYQRVVAENADLKQQLGIRTSPVKSSEPLPFQTTHRHSTTEEKIALFRCLFRGREDVFARRWQNISGEKSGYSPVCRNEWVRSVCLKPKQKCSDCRCRDLAPLTDEDVNKHLRGTDPHCRDVVGIYPMLRDETTYFLAVDFDGDGWENDATSFFATCKEHHIDAAIERSRSGNGSHVWIFFDEAIPAGTARKLGSCLLTETMQKHHQVRFTSYDRFFPNQDTLPTGGFGNLIAAPLQGHARKKGNSVFLDENLTPYPDQWVFLSALKKNTEKSVNQILGQLAADELGELNRSENFIADDTTDVSFPKPYHWRRSVPPPPLTKHDFPDDFCVIQSNMLYVNKTGVTSRGLNRIKRLAAFKNPDFFKTQAMRLSTWNKPRIISTSEETEEYIAIPRGLEEPLITLFKEADTTCKFQDGRFGGTQIMVSFQGTLYPEQQTAADTMLSHENGVLAATTAFGKTVIGSYMIAQKCTNVIVLVHTQSLLSQWRESLAKFLDLKTIGSFGGGKKSRTGIVDIATMQSLVRNGVVSEIVNDYGMVLVDECHHVSAFTFEQILKRTPAKYVYGLTATPQRSDGLHPIIFMQCGPLRYKVDAKSQAARRGFDHFLIPRFTRFKSGRTDTTNKTPAIQEIYTEMCQDEHRNRQILEEVVAATEKGRRSIILTQRTNHAEILAEALKTKIKNVVLLTGNATQRVRHERMLELKNIPPTEPFVIVATGKYVGEGFDEPRLDTLFLAMPVSWKGTLAQYVGRLHRQFEGKTHVLVYDYVDIREKMLESMFHKRSKGYTELGYKMTVDEDTEEKTGVLFDEKNFFRAFSQDIATAQEEIILVSPFIRKVRARQVFRLFVKPLAEGVKLRVVTRSPNKYRPEDGAMIQEVTDDWIRHGIDIRYDDTIHQKFAVFDRRTVWYGSLNFLSYGTSAETLMRFENRTLAEELLETL